MYMHTKEIAINKNINPWEGHDNEILRRIRLIKSRYTYWGESRIWAYLHYIDQMKVSRSDVSLAMKHKLHSKHSCLEAKNNNALTYSENSSLKSIDFCWYVDMFKFRISSCYLIFLIIVRDCYTGKIIGYHAGCNSKSLQWLVALNNALRSSYSLSEASSSQSNIIIITDTKPQPTSVSFMRACWDLGIYQYIVQNHAQKKYLSGINKEFYSYIREKMNNVKHYQYRDIIRNTLPEMINNYNFLISPPHAA